ncbi:MAG: hypothetical protein GTO63_21425, partial [Anaerolineae bacterium]|nr:hypothetical protein [Anaerolineae bacterium]NIN97348.1 hypothetical protein [Anaerolineae bacterium]
MKHPVGGILLPLVLLSLAGLVSDSGAREPQTASLPDTKEADNKQAGRKPEENLFGGGLEANPVTLATAGLQVEQLTDWADVLELLPKDAAGGVDWVRAL